VRPSFFHNFLTIPNHICWKAIEERMRIYQPTVEKWLNVLVDKQKAKACLGFSSNPAIGKLAGPAHRCASRFWAKLNREHGLKFLLKVAAFPGRWLELAVDL
jgi:hypothetical protein